MFKNYSLKRVCSISRRLAPSAPRPPYAAKLSKPFSVMGIFGVDKRTADALLSREHTQSPGNCVAVTRDGEGTPLRKALRLKKKPTAPG